MTTTSRQGHVPFRSLAVLRLVAALAGAAAACGGSSKSPTSPSGSGPGVGGSLSACRTFSTADTMVLTHSSGISGSATKTCSYDRNSNELTCNLEYADTRPSGFTSTTVFKFASVSDFIGDAPRVILQGDSVTHPASVTSTTAIGGTFVTSTSVYSYDAQGRPLRIATQASSGGSEVLTFTQWDSYGRPTAATGTTSAFSYNYDDTNRTGTTANLSSGAVLVTTFDANGIQIGQSSSGPGGTENQIFTIQSTATVCR